MSPISNSLSNILKIPTYTIEISNCKNLDKNLLFEVLEEIGWSFSITYHDNRLSIKIRPAGEINGELYWRDIDSEVINAVIRIEATGIPSFQISCLKKSGFFSFSRSFFVRSEGKTILIR